MTNPIRQFLAKQKSNALHWLARQLRSIEKKPAHLAVIGAGAQLGPEAIIDNLRGEPDAIAIGADSFIRGRLLVYGHGGKITVGEWCYIGVRTEIWSMESVQIGNRVLISHNVNIHDGSAHSMDAVERHEHFKRITTTGHPRTWDGMPGVSAAPIVIEDDVWISFGVTILKGVRIGARSIIAAGALVTHDVPPDTLYYNRVTPMMKPLAETTFIDTQP
jgi:acetyltransferase-like isoleucine patch superfamily enzyme